MENAAAFFFSHSLPSISITNHILFIIFRRRKSIEKKTNNNNNENSSSSSSSIHATKKHKTNAISPAFTIEAIVISEVFTFCVLFDELAACNAAYRCFNADTDSFLFIESIIIVVCVSKPCVCNEMTMQLVINYQSVYRFDVSFLYVDEYIYFWILCIFPAIEPSTVQMAIWGIVIAVLEIANANKRSKFYLLISFCFVFFRCLVQFILVEQGEKNGKHALFAPVDLSQQKKFTDWNNSCRMNRQKYGTFFFCI